MGLPETSPPPPAPPLPGGPTVGFSVEYGEVLAESERFCGEIERQFRGTRLSITRASGVFLIATSSLLITLDIFTLLTFHGPYPPPLVDQIFQLSVAVLLGVVGLINAIAPLGLRSLQERNQARISRWFEPPPTAAGGISGLLDRLGRLNREATKLRFVSGNWAIWLFGVLAVAFVLLGGATVASVLHAPNHPNGALVVGELAATILGGAGVFAYTTIWGWPLIAEARRASETLRNIQAHLDLLIGQFWGRL